MYNYAISFTEVEFVVIAFDAVGSDAVTFDAVLPCKSGVVELVCSISRDLWGWFIRFGMRVRKKHGKA